VSFVRRSIVIASTRPVAKYPGVRLSVEALRQMRDNLAAGQIPMAFDHDVTRPLRGVVLEPRIEADGDHYRLVGELEIEQDDWDYMQARFAQAGVGGGFSFSATEQQAHLDGPPDMPPLMLSADAAAYSDEQRLRAGAMLARVAPVEVNRLYQFNVDAATIMLAIVVPMLVNLSTSFMYDALKDALLELLGGREKRDDERAPLASSRVQLELEHEDGRKQYALIESDDPELVRAAIDSLGRVIASADDQLRFDAADRLWLPPGGRDEQ
jgi:hypothetical protein